MTVWLDWVAWFYVVFMASAFATAALDISKPAGARRVAFVAAVLSVAALSARLALWWHS